MTKKEAIQAFIDRATAVLVGIENNTYTNPIVHKIAEQVTQGGLNAYDEYVGMLRSNSDIDEELDAIWMAVDNIREFNYNGIVPEDMVDSIVREGLNAINI